MELTDREIRSVGFDRYVRRRILRIVSVGLVLLGLLILVRGLMPADPTFLRWWVGAVLVLPYGGVLWLFWRAHKAGKRFLNEWIYDQASKRGLLMGLGGADYRNDN